MPGMGDDRDFAWYDLLPTMEERSPAIEFGETGPAPAGDQSGDLALGGVGLGSGRRSITAFAVHGRPLFEEKQPLSNVKCVISGTQWQWRCVLDHARHRRSKSGFSEKLSQHNCSSRTISRPRTYCLHCDGCNRRKGKPSHPHTIATRRHEQLGMTRQVPRHPGDNVQEHHKRCFFSSRHKLTHRAWQFRLIPNKSPRLVASSLASMGQPTALPNHSYLGSGSHLSKGP